MNSKDTGTIFIIVVMIIVSLVTVYGFSNI